MKVTVHGPLAGVVPDGSIQSWGPDHPVEVDDADVALVAHYRSMAANGAATIVEDAAAPASESSLADLKARAEALGLATYGSKAQLAERIANAEQEA